MSSSVVIRVISRIMIPVINLYALYVIGHGDLGPGGGFQGGIILGSSFILYVLAFGLGKQDSEYRETIAKYFSVGGVILYAGVGLLCVLMGGSFLDYRVLAEDPLQGNHWGIFGIEVGVAATVSGVTALIFLRLSRK